MARGLSLALALGLSACAVTNEPPTVAPEALSDSRDFQQSYEVALRASPTSFLTTVAAYYLAPGDALELARSEAGWVEASSSAAAELGVQAAIEGVEVWFGSQRHRIEESGELEIDERFTLAISRQELDWRVLIHDRDAPARAQFPGVEWFPVVGTFVFVATYTARGVREPMLLQTSRGVSKTLYVAGEVEFTLEGATASLLVFAYAPDPVPGEPVLIPFRDATSGNQTYTAGRYLELEARSDSELVLDFNRATNPLCAYSEHYNCPMPPRFNTLDIAIEAGAKAPH